ncbi:MAG: hypothetical protein HGA19_24545, partial [Oscillochloris sp.]|nr:hypothetical protein [Oscillochloris sp.]
GTPMLDPLSGLLFLMGLMLLLTDRRLHESLPLLALLGVGLIPGMLSSDAPHAVRTVDAIAPSLLIAAYAVVRMVPVVVRQPVPIRGGIIGSAVAFVVLINAWGYLGRVPYDPRVWDAFHYTAETAIGQAIHDGACSGTALLPERPAQSEAVSYLAYGHSVEPFRIDRLPEHFPSGSCVFFPANFALEERAQVEHVIAGAAKPQVLQYYPGTDLPVFLLYKIP